jgi:hypothetical protein
MRKKLTDFERAERALPMCMIGGMLGNETTVSDLAFQVETEIDLTVESQDGTQRRNLKPLMAWLKRFYPESEYLPKVTTP